MNNCFLTLYLIESFEEITGTAALFVFRELINFFRRLILKFGLAASWIKTLTGLNFFIYFNAIKDESDLSFPPLIIKTFLGYFFWFVFYH